MVDPETNTATDTDTDWATLTEAQVFQMYLPRSIGGPEVHPLTAVAICEEPARHDPSVAWCAQVAAATATILDHTD